LINLEWYAAIGYGDILLPISYAHNISHTFKEEVNINLLYKEGVDYKYNENSKEFLWEQAEYLNSICDKSDIAGVTLSHKFHDTSKIRWSGYDQSLLTKVKYHNQWYINKIRSEKNPKIVIGSTVNNKIPLMKYQGGSKTWKSSQDWAMLENSLKTISDSYEIVHIDYTTPLKQAIEELKDASLFIGYHGGMAWLARFWTTPSIVLVKPNSLSSNVFSNAMVRRGVHIRDIDHIEVLIRECTSILERYMINFKNRDSAKHHLENALSKTLYVP
jgi:hypothetical protein